MLFNSTGANIYKNIIFLSCGTKKNLIGLFKICFQAIYCSKKSD